MFAKRIKFLRQSKELNQVQLAERLGVKKQSISNWENDNIMPSIDMLIRIADFFRFPLADQFLRGGAAGQAALGGDYVLVTLAPVPIPLTLPVKFPIVPLGLFQIVGNLGADLDRHKPPVDFDGNFHRPFLRSDFWGLNGGEGSGSGAGVAGLGIEKCPDSARLFGRWGQHYDLLRNDYFRNLGWSAPLDRSFAL